MLIRLAAKVGALDDPLNIETRETSKTLVRGNSEHRKCGPVSVQTIYFFLSSFLKKSCSRNNLFLDNLRVLKL